LVISNAKRELDAVLLHLIDGAYTYARWAVGDPVEAERVVQNALTRVERSPKDLRGGSARVYVLRMVRTTVLDRIQSVSGNSSPLPSDPRSFSDLTVPSQPGSNIGARAAGIALQQSDIKTLRTAIADLSLEQREVVLLRDTEGLSYRDIAAILVVSPSAITSRLWRARDRLQLCFGAAHASSADHERSPTLMDAYIDAEIDIDTAATFVQHIAQCRHCTSRLLIRSRLVQHIRNVTQCRAPDELHRRMHRQLA
jgi:RNA polymerase sigma factor (sigma-70 family)